MSLSVRPTGKPFAFPDRLAGKRSKSLLATIVADSHRCLHCIGEILSLKPERQVNQVNEHRYLDQRSDNCCKCLTGVDETIENFKTIIYLVNE